MNIYITKDNTNRLKTEASKSGLINRLLNEYYEHAHSHDHTSVITPPIIKTADQVMVKPRSESGFCANGHAIPAGRTKCLGKGCKYS